MRGRASLRSWLYRIATNACLKHARRRPKRLLSADYLPPSDTVFDLGEPIAEPSWLEPYPTGIPGWAASAVDPAASYELRESVELAFIAALQHLPARQRAVLVLCEVLAFSAAEVAAMLDTTVASVNSSLQRARQSLDQRIGGESQQSALRALGEPGRQELADAFVAAWERADVPAILALLTDDARFTMPPLPAWFDGLDDVGRFLAERVFATPVAVGSARGERQVAFACYQGNAADDRFRLGALNVLTLRGGADRRDYRVPRSRGPRPVRALARVVEVRTRPSPVARPFPMPNDEFSALPGSLSVRRGCVHVER
jgi:RNA polymerase sigma-70 factor (ECF subfamily)